MLTLSGSSDHNEAYTRVLEKVCSNFKTDVELTYYDSVSVNTENDHNKSS